MTQCMWKSSTANASASHVCTQHVQLPTSTRAVMDTSLAEAGGFAQEAPAADAVVGDPSQIYRLCHAWPCSWCCVTASHGGATASELVMLSWLGLLCAIGGATDHFRLQYKAL
eukprot:363901-Chlamydomonas_euryale.AAC.32